jgi:hypothetical protein
MALQDSRTVAKNNGEYFERHHILPKSMGGDNSKHNLVLLTAREHFLSHWLLWKIHKNREMAWAFTCFRTSRWKTTKEHRGSIFSRRYEILRKIANTANRGEFSSRGFRGKHHTEQAKQQMREAKIGDKNPMSNLGHLHPNCRRRGEHNPNYGLKPWNNGNVIGNDRLLHLWSFRELFFQYWLKMKSPHWYQFGKNCLGLFDHAGYEYTPHNFCKMFQYFQRGGTVS